MHKNSGILLLVCLIRHSVSRTTGYTVCRISDMMQCVCMNRDKSSVIRLQPWHFESELEFLLFRAEKDFPGSIQLLKVSNCFIYKDGSHTYVLHICLSRTFLQSITPIKHCTYEYGRNACICFCIAYHCKEVVRQWFSSLNWSFLVLFTDWCHSNLPPLMIRCGILVDKIGWGRRGQLITAGHMLL